LSKHPRGIIQSNSQIKEPALPAMIKSIHIEGYRGFSDFGMSGLQRVTLLVGNNNSGKTSVLESLFLLASQGDPYSLWRVMWRRSERMPERATANYPELDVSHLFHGHEIHLGSKFILSAENQSPGRSVQFLIGEIPKEQSPQTPVAPGGIPTPSRVGLHIVAKPGTSAFVPLTRSGGLTSEALDSPRRLVRKRNNEEGVPAQFITAESFSGNELLALWDTVALTSSEERVLEALRLLEPDIERIAATAGNPPEFYGQPTNSRGGFRVKFKNIERPVPIGSMGDGTWRLLAMATVISQCKGGVLLIDEIDTGLHYSVMTRMWKLIFGAAKELDVQVFATTHSFDCVKSLAQLCHSDSEAADSVSVQRIERHEPLAVPYTSKEIEVAALNQIEVR